MNGTLKKAAATYAEQRKNGNYVNATKLALKYLNEDAAFSNAIHQLFSNINPMPFRELREMRKSESAVSRCKTISMVQKLLGGKYKIEFLIRSRSYESLGR